MASRELSSPLTVVRASSKMWCTRLIFQAAFGDHDVDVGFEAEATPGGVDGVDQANAEAGVKVIQQFADGLGGGFQENPQRSQWSRKIWRKRLWPVG